jgi:hypothetical protein
MTVFRFVLITLLALVMGSVETGEIEKVARRPLTHTSIRTLHEVTACKAKPCVTTTAIRLWTPVRKPVRRFIPAQPIRKLPPPVSDNSDSTAARSL